MDGNLWTSKKNTWKKDVDMDRYKNTKKSFKKFHGCVFVDNVLIFSIIYKNVDMDTWIIEL